MSKRVLVPSLEEIEAERERLAHAGRYRKALKNTMFTLVVVAAAAVLAATLLLPFLRIYGESMSPTLQNEEVVCGVKTSDLSSGEIVAFYYNNKVLVKRVIAHSGEWVNIDEAGNVYVDGTLLEEPYLQEKALGECDIKFPYQVPEGRVFVLGDHRSVSVDSRSTSVGCVSQEQIVGKIFLRVWPLSRIGVVS